MSGFDTSQIARILTYGHNDTLGARPTTDTRKRVLLIEGDGFIRMRLMSCLVAAGFDVDTAPNGTLGLAKLRIFAPDTLILDLNVGGTSGLKVIQESRRYAGFDNKPIYAFTFADFIKRNVRKDLAAAGVRVFDKMTISEETFVCNIAAEVLKGKSDVESLAGNATAPVRTTDAGAPVQGRLNETVDDACQQAKRLASCADAGQLAETCASLREKVYSVLSCAAVGGLRNTVRQAKALVGFLDQINEQPHNLNAASLDTIEGGVEMLSSLASESAGEADKVSNFNVVVVDDVATSREAVTNVLEDAGLASSSFADSVQALEHLSGTPADLIIAKLAPDAHPEAALASIRALQLHSETPVIFVPSPTAPDHSDASAAAASTAPETQPVMPMEILVKALNVLQSGAKADAPAPPDTEMLQAAQPEEAEPSRIDTSRAEIIPDRPMGDPLAPSVSLPWVPVESGVAEPQFVAEQEEPAPKSASRRKQKRTILLVEDDPVLLKLYRRGLSKEGFKVETAEDGMAALDVLPKVRPDLVVLDIMLPKLHGLEVLKFIRTDVNLKDTPVIILSNAFMESLASRAMKAGANKGLLKSDCTPAKLVSVISSLLPPAQEVPADAPEPEPAPGEMVNPGDFEETAIWVRKNNTLRDAPAEILKIRQACAAYAKAAGTEEGDVCLEAFYRNVRLFSSRAGQSGFTKIDWVASALEALLFEITYKQLKPTPSTMRTIAQAVDCIGQLVESGDTTLAEQTRKPRILVVDDDAVCTLTTVAALRMARVEAVGTQSPRESLQMLEADTFDMVILDIDMPDINGFEVCEQLRLMPRYKTCPVMFVTSMQAVDSRARGILAGASEYVNKPIPPAELTLKVTLLMAKSAQTQQPQPQAGEPFPIATDAEAAAAATPVAEEPTIPAGNEQITIVEQNFVVNPGSESTMPPADIEPVFMASSEAAPPADVPAVEPISEAPQAGEDAQPLEGEGEGEAAGAPPESKDKLVARIYNTEVQLHHERERIKRRDRTIEILKKEIQQLKDETVPATSPSALAEAAGAAAKQAKQALELAETRCNQLEHDLTDMWKVRDELNGQLTWEQAHAAELDKRGKELESRLTESTTALQQSKEELEKASKDRTQAESDLKQQLNAAGAAQQQAVARCHQLETDLAALLQSREQLNVKVAQQEGQAAELNKRSQELESSLNERSAELVRIKSELEKQGKERAQAEFELRTRLETTDAAQKNAQARCGQLEADLAGMRQAREDLSRQVSAGQSQASDLSKRSQDLEKSLNERSAELARAKTDLEKQVKERAQAEADLRVKLDSADAGQKQAQSRCGQLEQELAALKLAREELNQKVTQEHGQASELSKRGQELEKSLAERGAALERAKGELEKQAKERFAAEVEMRTRLETVEAAQKQSQARCAQLEQELSGLKQVREELNQKVSVEHGQATEQSKRSQELEKSLNQRSAELVQAKAEQEKQAKEHAEAEAGLRSRLELAEGGEKQAQARYGQLQEELSRLKQVRAELDQRVTSEHELSLGLSKRSYDLEKILSERGAELERAKGELEKQAKERAQAESELRGKLEATDAAHKQVQDRCGQLEQELAGLKKVREELNQKVSVEHGQATELSKRSQELEKGLNERSAELVRAKSELEKLTKEHSKLEKSLGERTTELVLARSQFEEQAKDQSKAAADLRKKLETAETAQKQSASRCNQLEQELAALHKAQNELNSKLTREQDQSVEAEKRHKETTGKLAEVRARVTELNERGKGLETSLNERSAELVRAKAELEKQSKERAQAETEMRGKLETTDAAHKQAQSRCSQLEQELSGLKQVREELNQKVSAEHGQATELSKRSQELEKSLNQRSTELVQAKAEMEKQAKVRAQAETELRGKLETTDAAHKQAQARCSQLETDLAGMRQARAELSQKVSEEQGHAAELTKRGQELEKSLNERSAELARANAELDKLAKERSNSEGAFRGKLETAEAAQRLAQSLCSQLEQDLVRMRQAQEELSQRVSVEQGHTSQLSKRGQELEKSLNERSAELAQAKAEMEKQAKEHAQAEAEMRGKFESADSAHKQTQARCSQLEQELASLKQVREELNQKVSVEHGQATELSKRSQELENSLNQRSTELVQAKTDLEKQAKERTEAEAELRGKLETVDAAHKQAQSRCSQLEQELAGLKQVREELNQKVSVEHGQATELSKRSQELEKSLNQRSTELAQAKTDLEKQSKERTLAEAELRGKLEATDAAYNQVQGRCSQLEQELAGLKQARAELDQKVASEHELAVGLSKRSYELEKTLGERGAELDRAKAELEKQAKERAQVEAELRGKLDATDAAQKQAQGRCSQLEQELAAIKQSREELQGKLIREQALVNDLDKRQKELQVSLGEKALELEKQARDRSQAESDLHQKLNASQAGEKQSQARCSQLEQELAGMQQAREDLNGKLAREQAQVAGLQKRGNELEKRIEQTECARRDSAAEFEQRIQQGVVSLAQATSAMETERAGRDRAEQRSAALTKQLEDLHEQLSRSLQSGRNSLQQITVLEKQLRENDEKSARLASDLRHEQAQARLVHEQSAKAKELNGQFQQNIAWLSEANRVLVSDQKSLQAMVEKSLGTQHETESRLHHEASQRLREREEFESAQRNLASQHQKIERLEAQIAEATATIAELEVRSKKESSERHNLLGALQAAQHEAQLRSEQSRLELSRLQSSLQLEQLERKRLETDQVRLRHSTIESARAARIVRNNLRRRIRQPIAELSQSTRRLLGLELNVEQKALVEAILKDALLVNERLHEPASAGAEAEPAPAVAK